MDTNPSNVKYSNDSISFFVKNGNTQSSKFATPVINKVELSQKQAMRRDENNIRVSSGVKYQLKFRGNGFECIDNVVARLGRIFSDDYRNQLSENDYPISWMSFDNERPIEYFDVLLPQNSLSEGSLDGEIRAEKNPVSPNSTNSNNTLNSPQTLKITFSLKKFSHIKKLDKSLPPAKKITFVLSIRFSPWKGEARVFFKFSTRSKAESSKEWKLEKVLDSDQHPNFIQLIEPRLSSPTSSISVSSIKESQYISESEETGSLIDQRITNFGNMIQEMQFINYANLLQGQYQPFVVNPLVYPPSPQSQVPSDPSPMNSDLQLHFNSQLNSILNQTSLQIQAQQNLQNLQNSQVNVSSKFQWNVQQPYMGDKSSPISRKRSRDSFTEEVFELFNQKPPKIRTFEDQLEYLSQTEGPAKKAHFVTGYGSFSCLKAPVYVYFGSVAGKVMQIQKDTILLQAPSHQPTIRPVNVTLQNSDRAPISSFAQYKFVEEKKDENPSQSSTLISNNQNNQNNFNNFTFPDFDLDIGLESIFDSDILSSQYMGFDTLGQTLLHRAAEAGHTRLIIRLLLEGFSPFFQDFLGRTPFHIACAVGNTDSAKMLLSFGSAKLLNIEDVFEMTGLDLASSYGHNYLIKGVSNFLGVGRIRNNYFDDIEIFIQNYPSLKGRSTWDYKRNGDEGEVDIILTPIEIENKMLKEKIENLQKKMNLIQLSTQKKFIEKLRQESENRKFTREMESLIPELEQGFEVPTPEPENDLLANSIAKERK